ncbi:hypothetical protein [Phaeovulum sp. NW3]|uniref:hypothetical protein n=1 Tax=Phaeovulum sp. NW3 TaxID=2934933 RepID=UPI00201FE222|nr:hypothetical protein [Phaeovulum sp. NW3]MCL7466371.1 hypothetical protein [Phaeovulum sp. NW3]
MLDTTDLRGGADTRSGAPPTLELRPGAIVAFRFPMEVGPDTARPCLVLEVAFHAGKRFVTLAPDISLLPGRRRGPFDLKITPSAAMQGGVLTGPTVFLGAKRLIVSDRNSRFARSPDVGAPVLGWLTPEAMNRLQALRRRIRDAVRCAQGRA